MRTYQLNFLCVLAVLRHTTLWQLLYPLLSHLNSLRPRRNEQHFADDIFNCLFLNENVWIPIKISLKIVPMGPIDNIPSLVQIMAWRRRSASVSESLHTDVDIAIYTYICMLVIKKFLDTRTCRVRDEPFWILLLLANEWTFNLFCFYIYTKDLSPYWHFYNFFSSGSMAQWIDVFIPGGPCGIGTTCRNKCLQM